MNYYLRTLEGVKPMGYTSPYLSYAQVKEFANIVEKYFKAGYSIRDRYINAFKDYANALNKDMGPYWVKLNLDLILDYISDLDNTPGFTGFSELSQKLGAYESKIIREARDQAEAEQRANDMANVAKLRAEAEAAEAEERRLAEAEAEAAREALDVKRAQDMRRIEEERQEREYISTVEAERVNMLREEVEKNLNYIEAGQIVITDPEQIAIYESMTGRKYSDILQREAEAAAVYIEAMNTINEGEQMNEQNIEISPVVVTSEHEYSIIDENENTITYQDETGKLYIEQKAGDGLGWIAAAIIAGLLIL